MTGSQPKNPDQPDQRHACLAPSLCRLVRLNENVAGY